MRESIRKILMVFMAFGFLIGLAILLYPMFSNMWNQYNAKLKFEEYQIVAMENTRDESLVEEWEKAYAYNADLQPIIIPDSFIQAEGMKQEDSLYMSCLNVKGDGCMGYISIPKIEEIIPIYHTSSEEVLQKGAGHVQGSSLPVGGESTHAAISAHRGLPGASLFTDIDQLEVGDQFYLYILDDILAYEVDQILVVEPANTEALNVEPGEDQVTLITCTPYGVNSHRLLVRGHRVPYEKEVEEQQAKEVVHSAHTNYGIWILLGLLASGVCMLFSWIMIKIIRKIKKKNILLAVCLLLFLAGAELETQAAESDGETSQCSITFEIPKAYQKELQSESIPVRLYRIADMAENGAYEDITGCESLKLSELSTDATAQKLEEKAKEAARLLQAETWQESPVIAPDRQFQIVKNQANADDIEPGLYLVCVEPIQAGEYRYQALPYIISLPCLIEIEHNAGEVIQEWNYDIVVDLKLKCEKIVLPEEPEPEEPKEPEDTPEEPEEKELEQEAKVKYKTGDETKLKLLNVGVVLFGVLFLICLITALIKWSEYHKMRSHNDQIKEQVIAGTVEVAEEADIQNPSENMENTFLPSVDFDVLKEMNEKCVGWIYACNGEISYPIVASDDEYYLSHAVDGVESRAGAIFVNSSAENPFAENRAVIYGHNMKDGSMFHPLMQYWGGQDYLSKNPNIYIMTKEGVYIYKITDVYVAEYKDIKFNTSTEADTSRMIDLITCEYSGEDTRLVVEAVLR